jgi:hypothetical protein
MGTAIDQIVGTDLTAWMKPGIYPNIPFADYLAIDAVSNSRLGQLAKSPAHYKANAELEQTKPLVIGRLVHAGRLEPLSLIQRYAVCPDFHLDPGNRTDKGDPSQSTQTKWCKEQVANFGAANWGKEIVSRSWYDEMMAMVTSLDADPLAKEIFNEPGEVELTLVWNDDETGLLCKARLDKISRDRITDLKTTPDLSAFTRAMARYGYHRQGAHYRNGWSTLNGECLDFWIAAVEKSPPFCVQAAPVHEDSIESGELKRRELLRLLADCMDSDKWPGPPAPNAWRVPEYAMSSGDPLELIIDNVTVEM